LLNLDKIRDLERNYIFGVLPEPSHSISEKPEPDWFWSLDMITVIFGGLGCLYFFATFFGAKSDFWNFSYGGGLVSFGIAGGSLVVTRVLRHLRVWDFSHTQAAQQTQRDNIQTNRADIEKKLDMMKEEGAKKT
jgi:hypothetical protein